MCDLKKRVFNWEQELEWAVKRLKGKAMIAILLKAVWNAYIYHIWREKNNRIFAKKEGTIEQVLHHIK